MTYCPCKKATSGAHVLPRPAVQHTDHQSRAGVEVPTQAPWQACNAGQTVGMTSPLSWRSPHTSSQAAQEMQPTATAQSIHIMQKPGHSQQSCQVLHGTITHHDCVGEACEACTAQHGCLMAELTL